MTETIDPRQVSYVPLSTLAPDPRNPKAHDQETIDASIGRFGMLDLIVQDQRTGYIVSGHGRHKALSGMEERGETAPEGVKVSPEGQWLVPVVTGWASRTDTEASAALIALNRTTELGGWVDDALLDMLSDLDDGGEGLVGVGYSPAEVEDLRDHLAEVAASEDELDDLDADDWDVDEDGEPGEGLTDEERAQTGTALDKLDVLFGEPSHKVHAGEKWILTYPDVEDAPEHVLVVAGLSKEADHELWSPLLAGRRFAPYPEPYFSLSEIAASTPLLMVSPSKYLAGHLLDKHASVHGPASVTLEGGSK